MKLTIHHGSGHTCCSMIEVATDSARIILDCGKDLPPLDGASETDSFGLEGLTFGKSTYDAVFVAHCHADHSGLLERINPDIPIHMKYRTQRVLEAIADFIDGPSPRADRILQPGQAVSVGDLRVLPLEVRRSARGALMFLMEAGGKRLLYTGDFNHIDPSVLSLLGKVDVMLCEGTGIDQPDVPAWPTIEERAAQIMSKTQGQVFVLCSATNVDRVRSIERACRLSGRTLAIDPFAKAVFERVGYSIIGDPVGFVPYAIDAEKKPRAYKHMISEDRNWFEGRTFSDTGAVAKMSGLTFLVRQTMGDFLKQLDHLSPLAGSTLIYSIWRGCEDAAPTPEFLSLCRSLGLHIEYLHASGPAYRSASQQILLQVKPEMLIPVHAQSAAAFQGLHDNIVPLSNGQKLEI